MRHGHQTAFLKAICAIALVGSMYLGTVSGRAHEAHKHATDSPGRPVVLNIQTRQLNIKLSRHDGAEMAFKDAIDSPGPIFLNFIYTSCTTVCPLMGQIFSEIQPMLKTRGQAARMISVSIDPEYDTPARLAEHAAAIGAGPDWAFFTGTAQASQDLQQVYGVYTPDKMNHPIATFYRASKADKWVRIDGFQGPEDLLKAISDLDRRKPRANGKAK